jgi:hypothetical protein
MTGPKYTGLCHLPDKNGTLKVTSAAPRETERAVLSAQLNLNEPPAEGLIDAIKAAPPCTADQKKDIGLVDVPNMNKNIPGLNW